MKEFICLKCHSVFSAGVDYAKCCGELEVFDPSKHAELIIGSANAWHQVDHKWDDNEIYQKVLQEAHNRGQYGAARTLVEFVNELIETNQQLRDEMVCRAENNRAEWDIAKEMLKDPAKIILDEAWNRVCFGRVDYDENKHMNNHMMFDYPRYTWSELQDLIKGKR